MISAKRLCRNGRRRCWAPAGQPHAGRSPVCRPARSSRFCLCTTVQVWLKSFYHGFAEPLLRGYFPGMPCYEHFVALQKSAFVPLVFFLLSHLGTRTGLYYINSTALPVCDNHRISRHKVFAGLAQRGKTSMGWFFGLKLHLVFNNDNEIVALKLTPGNVHDTKPVPALTRKLTGKLFGDKGSIGRKWGCPGRCCKWMGVAQVDNYAASPRLARSEWSARVVARAAFRASRASLSFGNCL